MKVHVLQHAAFEVIGHVGNWLNEQQAQVGWTRFYESPALPDTTGLDLIVAMGGPMSVNDESDLPWLAPEKRFLQDAIRRGIPVLGICLGAQLIANALGARVHPNKHKEIGWFPVEAVAAEGDVFKLPPRIQTLHWHGETFEVPTGAVRLARSEATANQAFQYGRRTLALQFHPEVTPDVVRGFLGADPLPTGAFVQSAEAICTKEREVFEAQNALLSRMLDYLTDH